MNRIESIIKQIIEIEQCGVQTLAVKINFNDQGAE